MALYITVSFEDCIDCEVCCEVCPVTPCVFEMREGVAVVVYPDGCEECMLCTENCPTSAITMSRSEDNFRDIGKV